MMVIVAQTATRAAVSVRTHAMHRVCTASEQQVRESTQKSTREQWLVSIYMKRILGWRRARASTARASTIGSYSEVHVRWSAECRGNDWLILLGTDRLTAAHTRHIA